MKTDEPISAMILRFSAGASGTMRCRITDALNGESWTVADAAALYAHIRAQREGAPGGGSSAPDPKGSEPAEP